jgi:hypothetical protein
LQAFHRTIGLGYRPVLVTGGERERNLPGQEVVHQGIDLLAMQGPSVRPPSAVIARRISSAIRYWSSTTRTVRSLKGRSVIGDVLRFERGLFVKRNLQHRLYLLLTPGTGDVGLARAWLASSDEKVSSPSVSIGLTRKACGR